MTNVKNDEVNLPQAGSNVNSDEVKFDMKPLEDALLQDPEKRFGVVEFPYQSPEVVPMCWLKGNSCYWPTEEPSEEDKKKCEKPGEDWTPSEVDIKSVNLDTYDEASQSLSKYTAVPVSSDGGSSVSSDNSETETESEDVRPLPTPTINDNIIRGILENLRSGTFSPLQNVNHLKSLNVALSQNRELRELLCDKLNLSENLGHAVRGMLRTLMSYELATDFTWAGEPTEKESFRSLTNIISILVEALRRRPSFRNSSNIRTSIEPYIKNWLINAHKLI